MLWLIKLIIVLLLLTVLVNLALALKTMIKPSPNKSMSQYIGRRLMFSAAIVVAIVVLAIFGGLGFNPRPY
ncbi:DUF2909 family protein [Echinimonas agarilytica]|uniref:DUF2909 family protein n=1 Tax=Echinimonas agarilytica TaxID=1215918 RepID=A0AA41W8H5_9GAMM|nr:DUF2909 family protein [Echinimonas agarilytica]MCM2680915.1 DUF2909 family protein [Echinimonas agarilytica]